MKKLFTLALLLTVLQGQSQSFEGIVKWTMKMEITDPKLKAEMEANQQKMNDPANQAKMKAAMDKMNDPQMKAMMESNPQLKAQMEKMMKMQQGGDMSSMMPKGMIIKIKNQNTLTSMDGGMAEGQETLFLKDKGQTVRLNRKDKTYSVLATSGGASSGGSGNAMKPTVKITKTSETTTILGYKCTKYIAESSEGGHTMTQNIWTTTDIKDFDMKHLAQQRTAQGQSIFHEGIEGVPMKIEMASPQGNMVMEVAEIKRESLSASDFTIPSDYKEVKMTGRF